MHTRDAFEDTYSICRESKVFETCGGVIHCFTGKPQEAEKFLTLGSHISFSGIVSFKKAQEVQDSAKLVPIEKMLIETDAPFLAPIPHRGKRNEPAHVSLVAQKIAELKQISAETLASTTYQNAKKLFRIEYVSLKP